MWHNQSQEYKTRAGFIQNPGTDEIREKTGFLPWHTDEQEVWIIHMSMKKRILLLLVASLLGIAFLASLALAETGTAGDLVWKLDKGVLTVSGSGKFPAKGPWMQYAKKIKSIEIGDQIEGLETKALDGFPVLTYVHFGAGIKSIGWSDFGSVPTLQRLRFSGPINGFAIPIRVSEIVFDHPEATVTVDGSFVTAASGVKGAMYAIGEKKGTVSLPAGYRTVGMYSFNNMAKMKEIVLPEGLWGIYDYAFKGCTGLKSVTIPSTVTSVAEGAFSGCKALKEIVFLPEKVTLKQAFKDCTGLQEIVLPETDSLTADLFNGCTSLKKVVIAEGTEGIAKDAFRGCGKVAAVYIPASVTEIEEGAFDAALAKAKFQCPAGSYAESFLKKHGWKYETVTPIESIALSNADVSLGIKKSLTLKADVQPANATGRKKLIWVSSDEKVASVKGGKVKALKAGECDIYCIAMDGSNVREYCHITVIQQIKSLKAVKKHTLAVGDTWEPKVTVVPATATNQWLTWKSSNESVCTVDENGLVTAVGKGKCVITCTATDGSRATAKITITVK